MRATSSQASGKQQQAADHGPLGLDAARRLAIEHLADAVADGICAAVFSTVATGSIRLLKKSVERQENGRAGRRRQRLPSNLPCSAISPLSPLIFSYASVATVGTTHTLSSPSTSLE